MVRIAEARRSILQARNLSLRFGGITALDGVSMDVEEGQILGLVGPNGAGKTTVLNAISGVFPLSSGEILFEGNDVTHIPLHERTALGIGRTFQGVELFQDLSVLENLMIGRHHLMKANVVTAGLLIGPAKREEIAHRERVEEFIEFFELERFRKRRVGTLPYGIQKIVGMARALCSEPRLLLLDEVASGLNREEKEDLARFLLRARHTHKVTVIWVEHDVRMVSELADAVAVLDQGRLVVSGAPEQVLRSEQVRAVFLGRGSEDQPAAECEPEAVEA